MDLKATALLKLIYLEMFGHDMSWASFHVLEVMSCPKYPQKRVGYLAAVQSFRPDTEVLMLATNLLKKVLSKWLPEAFAYMAKAASGHLLSYGAHNVFTSHYPASHYHLLPSPLTIVRFAATIVTFEPKCSKEGCSCTISIGVGVSRHTEICVAKSKRHIDE